MKSRTFPISTNQSDTSVMDGLRFLVTHLKLRFDMILKRPVMLVIEPLAQAADFSI